MDIIRSGNDINVTWEVFGRNGLKYSLVGKVYRLWLVNGGQKKEIESYSVQSRNQVVFVVDDADLHTLGSYKLILQIREPGSVVEDATYDLTHVFQVVSSSYPMEANKSLNGKCDIKVSSILKNVYISELEGASAYEIAVKNGFVGTESEWLLTLIGIRSIEQTASSSASSGLNKLTFTLYDGTQTDLSVYNGAQGTPGATTLQSMSDVTISSPLSGQVLRYNGSKWVNGGANEYSYGQGIYISPQNVISADLREIASGLTDLGYNLNGGEGGGGSAATSLRALTDVSLTAPQDGQVLTYNAATSKWIAKTINIPSGGGDDPDPIDPSDLSNYVTKTGEETISGAKTFSAAVTMTDTMKVGWGTSILSESNASAKQRIYFGDVNHYLELNTNGYFFYGGGVYTESFVSGAGRSNIGGGGSGGSSTLGGLTDVSLDNLSNGMVLSYDSITDPSNPVWVAKSLSSFGNMSKFYFGTCTERASQDAASVTLNVTCDSFTQPDLADGTILFVLMDYGSDRHMTAKPTYLNVNGTGAVQVKSAFTAICWGGGEYVMLVHDGTDWKIQPTYGFILNHAGGGGGSSTIEAAWGNTYDSGTVRDLTINGTTEKVCLYGYSSGSGSGTSASWGRLFSDGTRELTIGSTTYRVCMQGYSSGGSSPVDLSDYVTLSTTQTISGSKTFSSALTLTDTLIVGSGANNTSGKKRIYFGDSSHYLELNANGYYFYGGGIYTDSFVSAAGLNTGGAITLASLTDTSISSPSNGQVLTYNSSTGKWIASSGSSSDERLKEDWQPIALSLDEVVAAPCGTFKWKGEEGRSAGSTAQYWNVIIPELTTTGDSWTLEYGQLAYIIGHKVAEEVIDLRKEVAELRRKVYVME